MKKIVILFFLLLLKTIGFAQTISPTEADEYCPHADYKNAQLGQANVFTFSINFGAPAADYKIADGTGSNIPVSCKVVAPLTPQSNGSEIGICQIAFEDQRSATPSFTILNKDNAVVKTFKFPLIRSLKGLKPEYNLPPQTIDLPLCTTGAIP